MPRQLKISGFHTSQAYSYSNSFISPSSVVHYYLNIAESQVSKRVGKQIRSLTLTMASVSMAMPLTYAIQNRINQPTSEAFLRGLPVRQSNKTLPPKSKWNLEFRLR